MLGNEVLDHARSSGLEMVTTDEMRGDFRFGRAIGRSISVGNAHCRIS